MIHLFLFLVSFNFLIAAPASSGGEAIQKGRDPVHLGAPTIWRDPGDVAALDFEGGPGGRDQAPKPPYTFIEENLSGTNPKIEVRDADDVKWSVKFGAEVQAETFATRIAWAAGYFVESCYFVASGNVIHVGKLDRAKNYIKSDGSFTNARFKRQHGEGVTKLDNEESWSWVQDPFIGSKELNGLKVIVMLLSNWDNKDVRDIKRGSNTAIFQYPLGDTTEDHYLITDWGASMGKWGGYVSREKWDLKGYVQQTPDFIKGVRGDSLLWGYSGQHTNDFTQNIRISDVRWLMQYISRITDDQLRNGLKASGAAPDEVEGFAKAIRTRIHEIETYIR